MKTLTYFVPVDFTDCSYNALQYAVTLARFSEGRVRLCHVIDLEEVPESDNQVVVTWSLDRLNRKASDKMNSLIELAALEGVGVDEVLVMGNVKLELLKQIEKSSPHVIVMGAKLEGEPEKGGMVNFLKRNTHVPVLVVPDSRSQKLPKQPVLVSEMNPEKVDSLEPFFSALGQTNKQLAIVDGNHEQTSRKLIDKLQSDYGLKASLVLPMKNGRTNGKQEEVHSNTNIFKRSRNFIERLFSKGELNEQVN